MLACQLHCNVDQPRGSQRGFTLVELMVVVAIVGIMAAAAMPSFSTWVQNTKIRTVAEAMQNGIRIAQIESIRRGSPTQFFLTAEAPSLSATASSTGLNWVVRTISPTLTAREFVQGGSLAGTANGAAITASNGATITFNSIGRLVSYTNAGVMSRAAGATFQISSTSADRPLNVVVSPSGSVRMCDPAKTRSSSAPDGC